MYSQCVVLFNLQSLTHKHGNYFLFNFLFIHHIDAEICDHKAALLAHNGLIHLEIFKEKSEGQPLIIALTLKVDQ